MHPAIAEKQEEIEAVCRRFNVRYLAVFGSAARGTDFDPRRSDVDFLVSFEPGSDAEASLRSYLDLRAALSSILGRPVDLVVEDSIQNPYLRQAIERGRETIHAA